MTDLLERFFALPNTLSASPILAIGLTLGAFFAGNWLFRRMGRPLWLPPVVLSAFLLSATIALLSLDYARYQQGAQWLMLLLGPATVALGIPLYALPNVFSREGLDIGTRFLLDQLPTLRPVSCAVDLACGNGVIGLAALQAGLATTVWVCDESAQAIASARVNAGRLLASTADQQTRFLHGDGLLAWTAEAPELVLCNPPFHAQHTVDDFVGRRLILQAAQVLAPGGALCLVANRHLDYRSVLQTGFKQWRVLAENRKFRVYLAER